MLRETGTNTVHYLNIPGKTIIGRAKLCDIQPESTSISKQHALILSEQSTTTGFRFWIEDLGSRNGTSIRNNGEWKIIQPNNRQKLFIGDLIKFGHSSSSFILENLPSNNNNNNNTYDLDSSDLLQEREPLKYSPEILSSSVSNARISKELNSEPSSSNKLNFSIEYPSSDQIKDFPPISVQVGNQYQSQPQQNLESSDQIVPKYSDSLDRSNTPNFGTN